MAKIQKRRAMHWKLYIKLKCGKWGDFVISDEAMFYFGGSYGRRRVGYVRMGENVGDKLKFVKRDAFARGFMAWAAVSSRGKSEIRIIPKRTQVNSEYYFNKVLKPFIQKDVPRLFPEGKHVMTFHQDSASS
ncbi:hypothetical protein DPMN_113188 [Dreissena polymorpha]|uniref:Transposase n=1 Tax=Dreissena polymorpha TaxID=45954 RepID=A0A9D4KHV8_DREPO|nr:hypothetical protein DPMN_113188 [Dreissena polymorpha]